MKPNSSLFPRFRWASACAPAMLFFWVLPPLNLRASTPPSQVELIKRHPTLPTPLRPVTDGPSAADSTALLQAITVHDSRTVSDDFAALLSFTQTHPDSAWTPAVNLNLGMLYYQAGYFSRATSAFQAAWTTARLGSGSSAEMIANQAVANLAVMHARVGHKAELTALLDEVKSRTFQGDAKVQIDRAAEGLQAMSVKPEVSFRCGPYALSSVAAAVGQAVPETFMNETSSTPQGFLLRELKDMAQQKLGMQTQVIKRLPGAVVPVPSVMHLKCLHFGAILESNEGSFLLKDPTFGNDTAMTQAAIEDESSGYFLIPAGPLPANCTTVSDEEAGTLFGRGHSGTTDLGPTDSCPSCMTGMAGYNFHLLRAGLAVTDVPISLPSPVGEELRLTVAYHQREADRPAIQNNTHFGQQWVSNWVAWLDESSTGFPALAKVFKPGGGHEEFTRTGSALNYSFQRSRTSGLQLVRIGAGHYELRSPDGSKLVYSRTMGAATRKVFLTQVVDPAGNTFTLNYDATYFYRIQSITSSASGRSLHFFYSDASDPFLVTDAADLANLGNAFKKAAFAYETVSGGIKRILSITDPVSIRSAFTYDASGFMKSLTTPYGTTIFTSASPTGSQGLPRWVAATDPQGNTEKVEYRVNVNLPKPTDYPDGVNTAPNFDWDDRNTFYWSKVMYKIGPDDPEYAHAYHWLQKDGADFALGVLEWEKPPLQGFIWYNYPGQSASQPYNVGTAPTPSKVGTMVEAEDGSLKSSVTTSAYHPVSGNLLTQTDASGIQTRHTYDAVPGADTVNPGTDVTKVEVFDAPASTWRTLYQVTAYQNHIPKDFIDEQGITHTRTINAQGQLTSESRSSTANSSTRTETTRLYYTASADGAIPAWSATASGYLRRIEVTDPNNAAAFITIAQYTYDSHGRVLTTTDAEDRSLTHGHDALDRPTSITYPDGSTETFAYSQDGQAILSPTEIKQRDGRKTRRRYNSLGQLAMSVDPMQQPTLYDWCLCGDLKKLTDAKGQTTTWRHDAQGRVTAKITPDNKTTSYDFYPSSGRLKSVTTPKDQGSPNPTYTLKYDVKGRLVLQDYTDASTADTRHTAFDFLNRVTTMTDGLGSHALSYIPFGQVGAGQISVHDGPLTHDALRHTFAHFGRPLRTENVSEPITAGSTVRQFIQHSYDFAGRSATLSTDLGLSTLGYLASNKTSRPDSLTQQIGGVNAVRSSYAYYPGTDTTHHGRLQSISHAFPAGGGTWAMKAQHDYQYDTAGRITSWRWQSVAFDAQPAVDRRWAISHDGADQLRSVISYSGSSSTVLEKWGYAYDPAGNRSYEEHDGTGIISKSGTANRLQQRGGAGSIRVSGTIDKASAVTVNGQPARVTSTAGAAPFRFEKDLAVGTGAQTFSIAATDGSTPPQTTTQTYSITIPATHQTYEHDLNGNLRHLRSGGTTVVRSYEWDAADRLTKIIYADNGSTTFQYDGMSQRRLITEKAADGSVTSTTRLLWKDGRVWQEQDASGRMTKRYHFNGVQTLTYTGASTTPVSTTSTLTLSDHLGSHREVVFMVSNVPTLVGRRDFDPYGKATQVGSVPTNAAYTGHWLHERSGLELALYRAYDAELGRWMNEDPIGERGGLNLYGFVGNGPVMRIDRLGLETLVIINGPTDSNPCGHAAIATTGQGLHSHGNNAKDPNGNHSHGNVTDYITDQATRRDTYHYILPTTPEQEKAINDYMDKMKSSKVGKLTDNCASRVSGALDAAGIPTNSGPGAPNQIRKAMEDLVKKGGANTAPIPQGSGHIPSFFGTFNP